MGETEYKEFWPEQRNPLTEGFFQSMMGEAGGFKQGMQEQLGRLRESSPEAMFNFYSQNVVPAMQGLQGPVAEAYQPWAEMASEAGVKAGAQTAARAGTFYTGATRGELQKQAMLPYLQAGTQMGQLGAQLAGKAYGTTAGAFQGYGQQTLGAAGLMGQGYGQAMGLAGQMAAPAWVTPTVVEETPWWQTLLGGAAGGLVGGLTGGLGAGVGLGLSNLIGGDPWGGAQPEESPYLYGG